MHPRKAFLIISSKHNAYQKYIWFPLYIFWI